jgi:hypothetical protein
MTPWYLYLIEIFIIGMAVISLVASIEKWNKSKINLNLFLIFLLGIVVFSSVRQLVFLSGIVEDITFGENLTILTVVTIILEIIPMQFLFYLKNWRKFYTFPVIFGFYISTAFFLSENELFYLLILIIVGVFLFIILFIEGIRAKNGISISISLIFLYGLAYFPGIFFLLSGIMRLMALVGITMGVFEFYEKYILIDKEVEKKVKNTWIAKMAGEEE